MQWAGFPMYGFHSPNKGIKVQNLAGWLALLVERLLRIAEAGGSITTAPSGPRVVAILSMPRAISATYVPPEVHRPPQYELGVSRKRARTTQRGSPVAVEFGVSRERARTTQ